MPPKKTTKKAAPNAAARIKPKKASADADVSAREFVRRLKQHTSAENATGYLRYFRTGKGEYAEGDKFIGVRMGQVFALAQEFIAMPPNEIETLMESPIHEIRAGAMSIMDKQGRSKKTTEARRNELYELYLRRHDRINNWDLVDLAAQYVVGGYLLDKPREVLYKLARSKNMWERRTAIVATAYFIRHKETTDTFQLAELLVNDPEDLVHKGTGWMLRFAGEIDRPALLQFLDKYAATMPRTLLRYSIEKLDKGQREHYLGLKPLA